MRTACLAPLAAATWAGLSLAASAATLMSTTTLDGNIVSNGTGPMEDYGKKYNGDYTLVASYTIVTIPDGMGGFKVDPTQSFVTFTDKTKKFGPFDTLKIPITGATGDLEVGDITGFSFMATNWYKNLPGYLTQNGIDGSVDIIASTGMLTGSYKYVPRDETKMTTVLNYVFTSPATLPAPAPGNFDPFPPVPEPATWALMLAGVALLGARLRARPSAGAVRSGLARPG